MSYLNYYLNPKNLRQTVLQSAEVIHNLDFDTIAVTGNSGLLVGAPLAVRLEKDLIIIRKSTENSHSEELVENWGHSQKILIVDDFIQSGKTMETIYEAIMDYCDSPKIIGAYLYARRGTVRECKGIIHKFPIYQRE